MSILSKFDGNQRSKSALTITSNVKRMFHQHERVCMNVTLTRPCRVVLNASCFSDGALALRRAQYRAEGACMYGFYGAYD